jgi:hypothetical protein
MDNIYIFLWIKGADSFGRSQFTGSGRTSSRSREIIKSLRISISEDMGVISLGTYRAKPGKGIVGGISRECVNRCEPSGVLRVTMRITGIKWTVVMKQPRAIDAGDI